MKTSNHYYSLLLRAIFYLLIMIFTACKADEKFDPYVEFSQSGDEFYWTSATYIRHPNVEGVYKAELTPVDGNPWRYTFSGPDLQYFNYNWNTGRISYNGTILKDKKLDENADGIYSILVGAYNKNGDASSLLLNIDANSSSRLPEQQPILRNGQLKWLSADSLNVNSQGNIDYRLEVAEHNGLPWYYTISGEDAFLFDLNNASGELRFKKPLTPWQAWDYDDDHSYKVLLGAYNSNGDHTVQLLTINNPIDGDFRALSASASLIFPPPNAEIGIGDTVKMTALVKVERGVKFASDQSPILNGQDMMLVDGENDLWQSEIQFDAGKNQLVLEFNEQNYNTEITNYKLTATENSLEIELGESDTYEQIVNLDFLGEGCTFNSFYESLDPYFGGGFEMDFMRHQFYFMDYWDGFCSVDMRTGDINYTEFTHSQYYPSLFLSASKDEVWILDGGNQFHRYHTELGERYDYPLVSGFPHRGGFTTDIEMHPENGDYIVLGGGLLGGNVLSIKDKTSEYANILLPDENSRWLTKGITVDWDNNKACIDTIGSALYQVDLSSGEIDVLLNYDTEVVEEFKRFSSILEKSGKSLIVSGKLLGGLFRYDLKTGATESLVDDKGAGLNIQAPGLLRGDIDKQVVYLYDEAQLLLFVVSLVTGDRVVMPWSAGVLPH